ncbi:hypothetical protein AAF712_014972 [Marasmius tenuissimus]|uniref:Uncharacterized protein n=1 Tax=Marasmius tenuissimus TaxID=585030 RepID=A0ABR2ZC35_9AGAR
MGRDLYHLVKFLPAYNLPSGMPPQRFNGANHGKECSAISTETQISRGGDSTAVHSRIPTHESKQEPAQSTAVQFQLPPPVTAAGSRTTLTPPNTQSMGARAYEQYLRPSELPPKMQPSELPPKYHYFDIFPFSLLVKSLIDGGKKVEGQKAAKVRARLLNKVREHNLPLKISLYLVGVMLQSMALSLLSLTSK